AQGGSGRIRAAWEAMGKKLPASPSYDPVESDAVTSAFFGDRVSPRSVLCIDTSSSMLQRTSLRSAGSQGRTVVKGERDRERSKATERKIDIVKRELERTVLALRPSCKFNVLSYNAAVLPWRGKGELKLHPANEGSLKDAAEFARRLATATGTNIHDALAEALEVPGVETVYLLSDGVPSVGGTKEEIERRVAALNYLRGVRIITYGFAAEESGAYDEDFMRRLAQRNWGWYRRLN
ncbi:MAG: hypothetical protein HY721_23985, partial [Planctomycetes bacterium]|nr:hypothetical protein [Planctomycetota bacterium]